MLNIMDRKILLLLGLPLLALAAESSKQQGLRGLEEDAPIVNGNIVTDRFKYPYYVHLFDFCGGTLIHDDIVLSAAHCFDNVSPGETTARMLTLTLQEEGVQRKVVTAVLPPQKIEDPNNVGDGFDYMVVKLSSSALVDDMMMPTGVTTVKLNRDPDFPVAGSTQTAIGYGLVARPPPTESNELREMTTTRISDNACLGAYTRAGLGNPPVENIQTILCTESEPSGVCNGDSGGPLLDLSTGTPVQVGIASFVVGGGCGTGYPDAWAEVTGGLDWIEKQVCLLTSFPPITCNWVQSFHITTTYFFDTHYEHDYYNSHIITDSEFEGLERLTTIYYRRLIAAAFSIPYEDVDVDLVQVKYYHISYGVTVHYDVVVCYRRNFKFPSKDETLAALADADSAGNYISDFVVLAEPVGSIFEKTVAVEITVEST